MKGVLKTIFSLKMLKSVAVQFLIIYGFFEVFLSSGSVFWPQKFDLGWEGLIIFSVSSLVLALVFSWPRKYISKRFHFPDTKIVVKEGDVLAEDGNLVIGFNDVFDTEIGSIISNNSLQGKFLATVYNNDRAKLDSEIAACINKIGIVGSNDSGKCLGKSVRYPIGTTVVLDGQRCKYFCCAYSEMDSNCNASSSIDHIWKALGQLWEAVRKNGEQRCISIPVIGSDLARVGGASHSLLIKLIAMSFLVASREKIIAKELQIIVYEMNTEKINLLEIKDYLTNLE